MRLGLNLGYLVGSDDPGDQLRLVQHAEQLGFDAVWAAEAYGSDAVSVLAWLAGRTEKIAIGSAVLQIPGRTPAMTAMTAASLDLLTAGRFRLGLGVSGPQVSEGWHGVRFDHPLARTREYVAIVRSALARETVSFDGDHYRLPLPDGPGKALKLTIVPPSERIPILVAAVGPRNLELAGEIADGWLAVFYSPEFAAEPLAAIRRGRERAGLDLDGFAVVPTIPVVIGDDPRRCADAIRPYAALYVGGMGSRKQNFYNALAVRMGFADAAAEVQELFLAGRPRDAAAALPYEFIDATSLLGPPQRIAERLAAFAESGVTDAALLPFGRTVDDKITILSAVAAAYTPA
ncbi:LLM class F420-dependent oxidoreductase [Microlunatus speluncae]|uniref:LLM class F420-dependent oxidoreductase n=1 Tax=Microlunatus speluncae TaxID=2594267 RepID=UPI0012665439|nr:LLM class F420-dependent oxidoreductase [Microlunatus speluncae]